MAQMQNPGKTLTSKINGGLRALPERWKAFLGYTQVDQQQPSDVAPSAAPTSTLIEGSVTQTATNERKKTNITINTPVGASMTEYVMVEGLLGTRLVTLPVTGAGTPTIDFKTIEAQETASGLNYSERVRTTVSAYPLKHGQEYIGEYNFLVPYTETTKADGSDIGNALTTIKPIDFSKADVKVEEIPTAALEAFYLTYPTTDRVFVPEELTALAVEWDTTTGDGNYSETGSGVSAGTLVKLGLTTTGRGSGSAGVLAEMVPQITHYWAHNVPVVDYFFFLPNPISQAALLTKLSALAGATVSLWPSFKLKAETLLLFGQKVTATAEARASCDVFISSTDVSEAKTEGHGSNNNFDQTVKAVTLPPMVHGVINVTGDLTKSIAAAAAASATIAAGTNFPGASDGASFSGTAAGYVTPTTLSATNPPAVPKTGLFLLTTDGSPYRWGYSTCRCRVIDASIFA